MVHIYINNKYICIFAYLYIYIWKYTATCIGFSIRFLLIFFPNLVFGLGEPLFARNVLAVVQAFPNIF